MKPVTGQKVRVHYTGTLDDGSEFDSSAGRDPLEFVVGSGQVIPGFDSAVGDLETGESATVTIPADEAYGPRYEEAVQQVPLDVFPDAPEVGWAVEMADPQGQRLAAVIIDVVDDYAVLDFNHPLAGQDLTFRIELVEVLDVETASPDDDAASVLADTAGEDE